MDKANELKCSFCSVRSCCTDNQKKLPEFCPMTEYGTTIKKANAKYFESKHNHSLALEAARIESEGYCNWTRIEETIAFAKRLGIKNIGIAHCVGLAREAQVVHKIFKLNGFVVNSVCCKVGNLDKLTLGMKEEEKIQPHHYETACNPIAQAKILEDAGSELNIVIGLCVGHDSLFFMHSNVPTTVLIVKDRVLGHNPAAAIYTKDSYYNRLKKRKDT